MVDKRPQVDPAGSMHGGDLVFDGDDAHAGFREEKRCGAADFAESLHGR